MHGNLYLAQREAQIRREAEQEQAQQWRLGNLARPRTASRLQLRSRLKSLASAAVGRVAGWLAGPSEPQQQCC